MKQYLIVFSLFLMSVLNNSCKKFIEVNAPIENYNGQNVYQDDMTATSVLTGIYAKIMGSTEGSFATGGKASHCSWVYLGMTMDCTEG